MVPAAVLVALALAAGWPGRTRDDSHHRLYAEARFPGGTSCFPLSIDTLFSIEGRLGSVSIEILDGRVRFASSPCPGQQCVAAGWLDSPGDLSVCMPSAVLVLVQSDSEGSGETPGGIDAVSF